MGALSGIAGFLAARGKHDAAAKFYRMAGDTEKVGDVLMAKGDYAEAEKLFVELGKTEKAGLAAAELGEYVRASEHFVKGGRVDQAAEVLAKGGETTRAIQLYVDNGKKTRAAAMCERIGDKHQAARLYTQCNDIDNAIRLYREVGDQQSLLALYRKRGDLPGAARECREHKEFAAAAALFEEISEFGSAAECYLASGQKAKAIELFLKQGDYLRAGEMYEEAGNLDLAAEAFEKVPGKELETAKLYARLVKPAEIRSLSFDGDVLCGAVATGADAAVLGMRNRNIVYGARDFQQRWQYRAAGEGVPSTIAISADGQHIAYGEETSPNSQQPNAIVVLDQSKQVSANFPVESAVKDIAFLLDGSAIVAAAGDQVIAINIEGGTLWQGAVDFRAWALALSPDGAHIAAGTLGGSIFLFTVEGKITKSVKLSDRVPRLCYSRDGSVLLAAVGDRAIHTLDATTLEHRNTIESPVDIRHLETMPGIDFIAIGGARDIALASLDGWFSSTKKCDAPILGLFVDAKEKTLFVSTEDKRLAGYIPEDCRKRAAEWYSKAGLLQEAARIYQEIEAYDKAYDLFRQIGDYEKAASTVHAIGDILMAARHYEVVGKHDKAARLYEEKDELVAAARCYGQAGVFDKAAELYERMGDRILAADFYEQAGQCRQAGMLFIQANQTDRAIGNLEASLDQKSDDTVAMFELGKLYAEVERHDDAIKLFQKLAENPDTKREALTHLGLSFMAKDLHEVAIDRFNEAIGDKRKPSLENIDLYYHIGCSFEALGRYAEAKEIFAKVLAIDYYYKDIQQKLATTTDFVTKGTMQTFMGAPTVTVGADGLPVSSGGDAGVAATVITGGTPSGGDSSQRYKIIKKLGQGGMGVVYLATDMKLSRQVAWKVLPAHLAGEKEFQLRLLREARAIAQITNNHIVNIYDIVTSPAECFITMEYIEGGTLRDKVKKNKQLPIAAAIRYSIQIADALGAAHKAGVVHRDVKPENIMINAVSDSVKVVDFGLARIAEDMNLTREGCVAGTIAYMAPEQIMAKPVGPHTDVYAMGGVFFEMLAGRLPFIGDNILAQHMHAPPPDILEFNSEVPPEVATIIKQCLAKAPEERPENCDGVIKILKQTARARDIDY